MADRMPHATPPGYTPPGYTPPPAPPYPEPAPRPIERALGGSPGGVVLRLALLSLLVGVLLAFMGMTPWGFFHWVRYWIEELLGTGLDAVRNLAGYIVSGAVIVLPLWLLARLLSRR